MPKSALLFWIFLCLVSHFLAHIKKFLINQYIIVCQLVTQDVTQE